MTRGKRIFCQLILLVCATALSVSVSAQVKLETVDKEIALPHVMATKFISADGTATMHLLFASSKPEGVVLSDAFGDPGFSLMVWVKNSGATAVRVEFGEKEPGRFSLNTFNVGGQDMALGGVSSGGDTVGIFKNLELKEDRVTGLLHYQGPPGTLAGNFDSAITTLREPTRTKGAHVGKSVQAKMLLAFVTAMDKLDFAAAAPLTLGDLEKDMGDIKSRMGEAAFREMLKEEFGDPKELKKRLSSPEAEIAEGKESAKIWLPPTAGASDKKRFSFVKVAEGWRVYW